MFQQWSRAGNTDYIGVCCPYKTPNMFSEHHYHTRTHKTGKERFDERNLNINVPECFDLLPKVIEFTEMLKKHKKIKDDCRNKSHACDLEKHKMLKTIHLLRIESIATALHDEFAASKAVTIKAQDLTDELKKLQNKDTAEETENFAKKRLEYEKNMETADVITYKR